jgi:hypothetical protein
MVNKIMYAQIQKLKRQGYQKKEISDKLRLNRKTVSKYYDMSEDDYVLYNQGFANREKIFSKYKSDIIEIYNHNDFAELNMSSIYDYLEEKYRKLPGNEQTLRNYINHLKFIGELDIQKNIRSYKKVSQLPYGKQLQIDFGEQKMKSGLKLYIYAGVLSASRYKYIALQEKPFTTLSVISHILDNFYYIDGMVEELVIDQDKLMVTGENHGDIIYTKDFKYFIDEMNLKLYVCRASDPESKGKIENVIKYVKYNFFSIRDFKEIKEANKQLRSWLNRRANGKISQATKRIPLEMLTEEQEKLKPVKNSIYRKDSIIGRDERSVSDNALISVNGSSYSVPSKYKNKSVEIYMTDKELFVFDPHTKKEIASHKLSFIIGSKIINREHYREKESSSKKLKNEVLEMYPSLENWQYFVQFNFKRYPRYVRDQCIVAKKYFHSTQIDIKSLESALRFCLDNKTYTFSNLKDSYDYYNKLINECEEIFADSIKEVNMQRYNKDKNPALLKVESRGLDEYQSLIKQ